MSEITIVFLIIAGVVALFMWDRLPVIIVCLGCALSLWATGVLTLGQSLAGFGDPATIFIASLFVIGGALEATGITAWTGKFLTDAAGNSRVRLLVIMMVMVGALAALISVNGAVAALMPVVIVIAVRLGRSPAQLLMPLVFAGHAGSMILLTGSPVNVLIHDFLIDIEGRGFGFFEYALAAGSMILLTGSPVNVLIHDFLIDIEGRGFGFFEYALAGVPLLAGAIAIVVLFGERLLPTRDGRNLPPDLSRHASTLVEQYRLAEGMHTLRVTRAPSSSSIVLRRACTRCASTRARRLSTRRAPRSISATGRVSVS